MYIKIDCNLVYTHMKRFKKRNIKDNCNLFVHTFAHTPSYKKGIIKMLSMLASLDLDYVGPMVDQIVLQPLSSQIPLATVL